VRQKHSLELHWFAQQTFAISDSTTSLANILRLANVFHVVVEIFLEQFLHLAKRLRHFKFVNIEGFEFWDLFKSYQDLSWNQELTNRRQGQIVWIGDLVPTIGTIVATLLWFHYGLITNWDPSI